MDKSGKLYLVSTPIGNLEDISSRALKILSEVDEVVCEEQRMGSTLMKRLGVKTPINLLNEHNEIEQTPVLLQALQSGQNLALISDAGTPVFADPGLELVRGAHRIKAKVIPVPGASSLMSALVCSGFSLQEFYYVGFLPRKSQDRLARLNTLMEIRTLLVFLEAPYRLNALLKDVDKVFKSSTPSVLAMNLTQPNENFIHGSLGKILKHFTNFPFKGEFVLMLNNQKSVPVKKRRT